jgi:cytochrome c553
MRDFFRTMLLGLLGCAASLSAAAVDDTMAQRMQACTVCHGKEGRAASDGYYPRIAGKPAGYLYNQLLNFREGRRHYAPMTALVDTLSEDYLREIAGYFGGLDLPYPPHQPVSAPPEVMRRGEQIVLRGDAARQLPACVQCHGTALTGVAPAIPGLLGVPVDYINAQLGAWKVGIRRARAPDCMAEIVRRLAPQDIAAVSRWLAAQPVPEHGKPAATLPQAALPLPCGVVLQGASR